MASHSAPFDANRGGRCGICDGPYQQGDDVCFCEGEICHTDCADDL